MHHLVVKLRLIFHQEVLIGVAWFPVIISLLLPAGSITIFVCELPAAFFQKWSLPLRFILLISFVWSGRSFIALRNVFKGLVSKSSFSSTIFIFSNWSGLCSSNGLLCCSRMGGNFALSGRRIFYSCLIGLLVIVLILSRRESPENLMFGQKSTSIVRISQSESCSWLLCWVTCRSGWE